MSDPNGAPAPDNGEGTAFAAGVAAATAERAAEEAQEAERSAELAEAVAEGAHERAAAAEDAAWDARAAVDELRAEVAGRFDSVRDELLNAIQGLGKAAGPGPAAPAPEKKAPPAPAEETPASSGKPKRSGYGSRTWFGVN